MGCDGGYSTYDNYDDRDYRNYSYDRGNNFSIGCFSGNGKVKLINNTYKKIKELKKGDVLENGAIVKCLIIIPINKKIEVVELNNEFFSLKHPVIFNGNWTYPKNIKKSEEIFIDNWYNLILSNGFSVKINNIEAITLGHNQKNGIAYHPYFGTEKVIDALKKYKTFKDGEIVIKKKLNIERDENGRIKKYY